MTSVRNICLLGLGEVGSLLGVQLSGSADVEVVAWDRQFDDPASGPSRNAVGAGLRQATSADTAAKGCQLVISAVTAAQALDAARSLLPGLSPGTWFVDLNSVSPATRRLVAEVVEEAGGRYVEVAVMSPIRPAGLASPMLAGGPHAQDFVPLARTLGFSGLAFCADGIGRASATKLCRSVVVKGLESLLVESLLAARYYGVDEAVIDSLGNLLPQVDWKERARYMISRSLEHGARRAEEMQEAARTVAESGINGWMSEACARSQAHAARWSQAAGNGELASMLDAMLGLRSDKPIEGKQAG